MKRKLAATRKPRFQRAKYIRSLHAIEHDWERWREHYANTNQRMKLEFLTRALMSVRQASDLLSDF